MKKVFAIFLSSMKKALPLFKGRNSMPHIFIRLENVCHYLTHCWHKINMSTSSFIQSVYSSVISIKYKLFKIKNKSTLSCTMILLSKIQKSFLNRFLRHIDTYTLNIHITFVNDADESHDIFS